MFNSRSLLDTGAEPGPGPWPGAWAQNFSSCPQFCSPFEVWQWPNSLWWALQASSSRLLSPVSRPPPPPDPVLACRRPQYGWPSLTGVTARLFATSPSAPHLLLTGCRLGWPRLRQGATQPLRRAAVQVRRPGGGAAAGAQPHNGVPPAALLMRCSAMPPARRGSGA